MNKLLMAAVAVTLGTASAASFADDGNFFVNGDLGQANYRIGKPSSDSFVHYNLDKTDIAGALRFGYRWHSVVDYGVEAGYVDLSQAQEKVRFSDIPVGFNADQKTRGWLVGGNLKYNIADRWYVSARGGWFRSRNEFELKGKGNVEIIGRAKDTNTGTGEYLGAGAGYNFNSHFSLGLSYDNYHARPSRGNSYDGGRIGTNIALYSISGEYRF